MQDGASIISFSVQGVGSTFNIGSIWQLLPHEDTDTILAPYISSDHSFDILQ